MAKHDNKYKPEYAEQLPDMFQEGQDVAEVALEFGISRRTFYNWLKKHEAFAEAYEVGKLKSEAWWAKLGRDGACGKAKINPTVWIFMMKNKFGYRDQPQPSEEEESTPIKIQIVREDGRKED